MIDVIPPSHLDARRETLFRRHQQQICERTDGMFAILMPLQWAAAIGGAVWLSPVTWSGTDYRVHPHIWLSILFGGALCSLPTTLALLLPGRVVTRYTIAVAQVLFSSLLIHISGGRIETHFHVFGSLAFLAQFAAQSRVLRPKLLRLAFERLRSLQRRAVVRVEHGHEFFEPCVCG